MKLDRLVASAREAAPEWSDLRADRVRDAMLAAQSRRATRNKLARRSAGVVSGVGLVVLMLRGFSAPAVAAVTPNGGEAAHEEPIASQYDALDTRGDGGYGRD